MTTPKPEKKSRTAQLQIPVEDFLRTRTQVIASIQTLQNAVNELLTCYIQHTGTIISPEAFDNFEFIMSSYQENLGGATLVRAPTASPADAEKPKRKRKRSTAVKDPNAPKKPLTAYFLFSQTARPQVKHDLGETASSKSVAEEVIKRWQDMPESEKQSWKDTYQKNREHYLEEFKDYMEHRGDPEHPALEEDLPDDDGVDAEVDTEADADAGASDTEEDESEDESDRSPTPQPPTPPVKAETKTPKVKRGATAASTSKTPKENGTAAAAPPAKAAAEAKPEKRKRKEEKEREREREPTPEEPKKKKSRKSKGGDEVEVPSSALNSTPAAEERKKARKDKVKKRKSDVA